MNRFGLGGSSDFWVFRTIPQERKDEILRCLVSAAVALLVAGCAATTATDDVRKAVADARGECEVVEGNTELLVTGSIAYCYTVTVEEDGWRRCEKVPHDIAPIAVPTGGHYDSDVDPYPCGNQIKRFCDSREEYNMGQCLDVSAIKHEEQYFRDNTFPSITSAEDCTSAQWFGTPTITANTLWCAFDGYDASENGCEWASGVWLPAEGTCLVPIETSTAHTAPSHTTPSDIDLTRCANNPNLSVRDPAMCGDAPPITDPVYLCQLEALEHVGSSHKSEASPSEIAARNDLVSGCEERYGQQ